MIHLDTHVVVWLAAGELDRIPDVVLDRLDREPAAISPMVELELAFLREIGRLSARPAPILAELSRSIGLMIDASAFGDVVSLAGRDEFGFTRDPFDRIIAAQAAAAGVPLVSKDRRLRERLDFVVWD